MDQASQTTHEESQATKGDLYEIRFQGHIHERWNELFEGLTITCEEDGTTRLSGKLPDQTALHSILLRIRNMNLKLISVHQLEGSLENEIHHEEENLKGIQE